jgi:lipoate-protein ligase A
VARPTWRLIVDGALPGALNMAIDRAMLKARHDGSSPATLRLYRWEVPTVSLGRFQKIDQVDLTECYRRGFDVVRRPTGGRGVLHDDELTYSVVAHTGDGVPRGVAASYRYLSAALAEAYRALGVEAELTQRARGPADSGACYLHATQADLSLGAAKLSGSAQVWSGDAVLQHGSFVRTRDADAEASIFRLGDRGRDALIASTATLSDAMGLSPSVDELVDVIAEAFERILGVDLRPAALSAEEARSASDTAPEHSIQVASRRA